jgi:hypothetical protein
MMAADAQYHSLKTSDDSVVEEDEPYFRREDGLFGSLRERLFSSKYFVKWRGVSVVILYMLSGILVLASSKFPKEGQCTRKMSTWCKSIPLNRWQSLKVTALERP